MKKQLVLIFFVLAFLPYASFAQPLSPGETTFTVGLSILVVPVVSSPYGGNPAYPNTSLSEAYPLGLDGTTAQLNIRWKAYYSDGESRPIDVFCYLNTRSKNCSSLGYMSGTEGGCTIDSPTYDYKNLNTVLCNFSSPEYSSLFGVANRSLQPVAFSPSTAPQGVLVGQTFSWRVSAVNLGVLRSAFEVNVTPLSPGTVYVNPPTGTTSPVSWGEIANFFTQLTFLVSGEQKLRVYTRPEADTATCSAATDCSGTVYGSTKVCFNDGCWNQQEVTIKVGLANLPEFGCTGIIQIIFLVAIVFALFLRKRSK
jgi:hypothetical protein